MKIKFLGDFTPKGQSADRPTYKKDEVVSFDGPVAETYARKYIERKIAEEVKAEAVVKIEETDVSHTQNFTQRRGRYQSAPQPEPEPEPQLESTEEQKPE